MIISLVPEGDQMTRQEAVAWYIQVRQALLEAADLADEARLAHDYADALAACAAAGFKTKDELREAARHPWRIAQ